jgi:phosphatidylinositol alpha-1,6-mannosyltransferase
MGLSAILQTKKFGIPSVVVSYGQTWLIDRYDRKIKHLQKYVLKNASRVVSTSEHCKRGALNLGCQEGKISVIYAGLDLSKFRPGLDRALFRKKYDIPEDAVVISILGLALKRKLAVILEAVKYLEDIPSRVILIGGTGAEFDYIKTFVGSLNKDFIRVLGFISEEDLPYFYAATDVFVTAPKTIIECMGLSMKESMACGVPVVGANIGGIPEAIVHGETGLLFENGNVKDMVFQIDRILEDKILRNKIIKQAREYVEKTFDLRALACETTDLFYDLLP